MTKKKSKKQQRRNDTPHQRAMTNPRVQQTLSALRASWNDLSPQERSEQLNKLVDSGCSLRGLSEELGIPLTTIRRYIASAHSSESGGDWIAMMETTLAKKPAKERDVSRIEAARESQAMLQRNRTAAPAIKETGQAKQERGALAAQPTKKIIARPESVATKVPPVKDDGLSGKESQVGNQRPQSPLEQWKQGHLSNSERIQRLISLPDSIKPRPHQNARSMGRQGRPLPPTD